MTKIIKLIYSDEQRVGKGVEDDPCRLVISLWAPDGTRLASHDTYTNESWINGEALRQLAGMQQPQ